MFITGKIRLIINFLGKGKYSIYRRVYACMHHMYIRIYVKSLLWYEVVTFCMGNNFPHYMYLLL